MFGQSTLFYRFELIQSCNSQWSLIPKVSRGAALQRLFLIQINWGSVSIAPLFYMLINSTLCVQLVLDSQKRVFSWGFGGYGRLGHAEQKDEMVPRLIKLFDFPGRGASQIYTGYQCSFAVTENGKNKSRCRRQDETRSQVVERGSSDQTAANYELPSFSTTSPGFALLNCTKCQILKVNFSSQNMIRECKQRWILKVADSWRWPQSALVKLLKNKRIYMFNQATCRFIYMLYVDE